MTETSIPVDLTNPGQVFACLGLVEAAAVLLGDAEGAFDWSEPANVRFHVRAEGDESPVGRVLRFLAEAKAAARAPAGSKNLDGWKDTWGPHPIETDRGLGYPMPEPPSPATLVCVLDDGTHQIELDHWGDKTERDNAKFWAGSGGYPGSALARDALELVRGRVGATTSDPFSLSAPQTSSFGLDWRRDYIPLDAGFSLNKHGNIEPFGFPIVELLGAIGLGHARPKRPDRRDKLTYDYAVIGRDGTSDDSFFPRPLLRAALGTAPLPFPTRRFRMFLNWPGQENQARAITTVIEETLS